MSTSTDELLANAARYAATYPADPPAGRPSTGVALVVCMDARIDVYRVFGLAPGEAHVIRNAGGLVTDDAIRSLAISQRYLGTREIILVHHTSCGMQGLDDEDFAAEMERQTGSRPAWTAGGFTDPVDDVRISARRLLDCPYLPARDHIRGFVFDVATGRLEEVEL